MLPTSSFAQSSCPNDPENYGNDVLLEKCSIGELSQLPESSIMKFSSGIIVQMYNSTLQKFTNDNLIKIGQDQGDLLGFLNRFSNDRLLSPPFSYDLLKQLPASRIETFPCDIQQKLGRSCPTVTKTPKIPTPSATSPSPTSLTPSPSEVVSPTSIPQLTVKSIILDTDQGQLAVRLDGQFAQKVKLTFKQEGSEQIANIPVKVTYSDDSQKTFLLQFKKKQISTPPTTTNPSLPYTSTKTMKIIAAFAYNNDEDKPNIPLDQLKQLLFGEANSVRSYFKENSYNQLDITGDVFGWIKLPYKKSSCNFLDWYNFVDSQVKAAGIKHGDYDAILYQFGNHDYNLACKDPNAPISNTGAITYLIEPRKERITGIVHPTTLGVYLHEIGHGLGANGKIIGHASFLNCGTKSIDIYSNCKVINYGDPYDVMGHTAWDKTFLFSSASRYKVGWLSENQAPVVSTNSTHTITVLEKYDPGIKTIRIKKLDTNEYYFISYRQPIGYDKTLSPSITRGASIHILGSSKSPPDFPGIYGHTYLIDTTPGNDVTDNAALGDGEFFYDHINKILIKQLSHDENSAKVEVSFGDSIPTSDSRKILQSIQFTNDVQISEEERKFINQDTQQHLQEEPSTAATPIPTTALTKTPAPTATPAPVKLIDFNNDGVVNIFDYVIFSQKRLGL